MDHLIIYVIKRMVLVHVNETLGGQNVTGTKGNLVLLFEESCACSVVCRAGDLF